MKDQDIQNLLGGFATDTLTDQERDLLFTAALTNQELFNALADEQALREFLTDPASRRHLLQTLEPREPGIFERLTSWMRRPVTWAVATAVVATLVVAVTVRPTRPPAVDMAKSAAPLRAISSLPVPEEPKPAPSLSAPAKPQIVEDRRARRDASPRTEREFANAPVAPPTLQAPPKLEMAPEATSKLKLAVLDFDSGATRAKEADKAGADEGKAASDLLGKKLDSSGYTIIDRKQVDKALDDQKLNNRQLDPSTAARVGRSVGADAVILGSVTRLQQAQKTKGAIAGFRPAAPAPQLKKDVQQEVQVTAQAINTQTASNLGTAVGQGEQIPGGGLAGAVDQVASSLGQQIQQNARIKIEGLITHVSGVILTINVGAKAGVKVGDRLEVRRAGKTIGAVTLNAVKDFFSVGAFEGTGPLRIGDSVVALQP